MSLILNQGTIIMSDTRSPSFFIKHSKKKQTIISSLNSKRMPWNNEFN